jgi:hypothetical protein
MSSNNNKRTYELLHYPKEGDVLGTFIATQPKYAAEKITTFLYKQHSEHEKFTDDSSYIVFKFRDTSDKKEYCYMGKIMKYEEPLIVNTKQGNTITYTYRTTVAVFDPNYIIESIRTKNDSGKSNNVNRSSNKSTDVKVKRKKNVNNRKK